jgi:hypothetical protein
MKSLAVVGMAAAAWWLVGCNPGGPAGAGATSSAVVVGASDEMADGCPTRLPGTRVVEADLDGAAALTFTTSGDVTELRRSVRRMAEMHNRSHRAGGMMASEGRMRGHGPGAMHARENGEHRGRMMGPGSMMPAASATVEESDRGARLVFKPEDPAELDRLRENARLRAQRMTAGGCPGLPSESDAAPVPPPLGPPP